MRGACREEVRFVQDSDHRGAVFLKVRDPGGFFFCAGNGCLFRREHYYRDVAAVRCLSGRAGAEEAQLPAVIKTGGIQQDTGADAVDLHALVDDVRGGAGGAGDDGDLLAGKSVDQRGFAGVHPSEEADVGAVRGRGLIQCVFHGRRKTPF